MIHQLSNRKEATGMIKDKSKRGLVVIDTRTRRLSERYSGNKPVFEVMPALIILALIVAVAIILAACGSAPVASKPVSKVTTQTNGKGHTKSTTTTAPANPGIDPSLPASTVPEQLAVLQAWNAGQQLINDYMAQPPAPVQADLVAHEDIATIYPKVADYYVDPELNQTWTILMNEKMQLAVNAAAILYQPKITALTPTTAAVAFCMSTSGATINGKPAPSNLGGGSSNIQGTADLVLAAGSWKTASESGSRVSKC
jgi:hypothetical protein